MPKVKEKTLTEEVPMDAYELALLFDTYGGMLTDKQRDCFDMRYNQDLSLAEIAEELQVSRQGVFDNLSRAEALLRNMEEKTCCVRRDLACRRAAAVILQSANALLDHPDVNVSAVAYKIAEAARELEE